jgi:hypothetical protein
MRANFSATPLSGALEGVDKERTAASAGHAEEDTGYPTLQCAQVRCWNSSFIETDMERHGKDQDDKNETRCPLPVIQHLVQHPPKTNWVIRGLPGYARKVVLLRISHDGRSPFVCESWLSRGKSMSGPAQRTPCALGTGLLVAQSAYPIFDQVRPIFRR